MTSKKMLKVKISENEYFHNKARLGSKPNWEILQKHGGYMITQKQYNEVLANKRLNKEVGR